MSHKFKPGDQVVRVVEGVWGVGRRATIIRKCPVYPDDYVVMSDTSYLGGDEINWHKDSMELEDVYNSPLRKALE